jgi:hypothetical protein
MLEPVGQCGHCRQICQVLVDADHLVEGEVKSKNACNRCGKEGVEQALGETEFFRGLYEDLEDCQGKDVLILCQLGYFLLKKVEIAGEGQVSFDIYLHSGGSGEFIVDRKHVPFTVFLKEYMRGQGWVSLDIQ